MSTTPTTPPTQAPAAAARLLVVDDNEANRETLSRRLLRRGYVVLTAVDGHDALRQIAEQPFDLILLDVMMPGISGLEVLQQLRRTYDSTTLPIIMATANDRSEDVVQALNLGANDYVTKPLDFPVVMARVSAQIQLKQNVELIRSLERSLSVRNAELEKAADRTRRELELASRVQTSFLPREMPNAPGLAFAWLFAPCEHLAGDALSVFTLDDTRSGAYILDVSGHGVAASLLSVAASRALTGVSGKSLLQRDDGSIATPAEVAQRLNEQFPFNVDTEQFFTFFYAQIDTPANALTYTSAGHPGAIRVRAGCRPLVLDQSGPPIGIGENYPETSVELIPGDRLFLYTDGVIEAMDPTGEQFGIERLANWLDRNTPGRSMDQTLAMLQVDLAAWRHQQPAADDVTLVAVERKA